MQHGLSTPGPWPVQLPSRVGCASLGMCRGGQAGLPEVCLDEEGRAGGLVLHSAGSEAVGCEWRG